MRTYLLRKYRLFRGTVAMLNYTVQSGAIPYGMKYAESDPVLFKCLKCYSIHSEHNTVIVAAFNDIFGRKINLTAIVKAAERYPERVSSISIF